MASTSKPPPLARKSSTRRDRSEPESTAVRKKFAIYMAKLLQIIDSCMRLG